MESLESKDVAVIITTFNDYEKTLVCLEKIHEQTDFPRRIVVCDNGSDNTVADKILAGWKQIAQRHNMSEPTEVFSNELQSSPLSLVRLSENEGYAVAVNSILRMLFYDKNCKAFWLLHNDVKPETFTLAALTRHATEEVKGKPEYKGIIGSTVLYMDREAMQCAGGGTFSRFLGKVRLYDEGISRYSLSDRIPTVQTLNFIYGASMLVRREVFEKIGLFAEEFFLFFEDVEFSLRAVGAGFQINWAPGAVVRHTGPVLGRPAPVRALNEAVELPKEADYYNIRNRFYLLRKLHPCSYILALFTLPIPLSVRMFKGQKSRFQTVLDAAFDGIKKRMNKAKTK